MTSLAAIEADDGTRTGASGYVPGVDGLRALAVAGVVIFHFSTDALRAGFLGVDVFFVVSGFLITRLLMREIAGTGGIGLVSFWGRRARRLLPAFAVMTVVVVIISAIEFTDNEMHDVRAHALGSLFYVANWVFIHGDASYFATLGRPSPFLHTWTLAIEEQFYLLFPLVMLVFRRSALRRPLVAAAVALALAAASAAWMWQLVEPHRDPSRGYFGSDSHASGILVGVALGFLFSSGVVDRVREGRAALANVVGIVALVGVLVTMRVAAEDTIVLYRGGFFWFSVASAVVVAVVVRFPGAPLSRFLGVGALVAIGLRSYSIYLWHWPIRVFVTGEKFHVHGVWLFLVRMVILVVVSEVSFRLVEQPFRTGRIAQRTGSRGAIAAFASLILLTFVLVQTAARPRELPPTSLAAVTVPSTVPPPTTSTAPGETTVPVPVISRIDIFGDSTALVFGLAAALQPEAVPGVSVGGNAQLGCGFVDTDQYANGRILPRHPDCDGWEERWRQILRDEPDATLAVMTGAWDVLDHRVDGRTISFGTDEWTNLVRDSYRHAFGILTGDGRNVYVFAIPCYGEGEAAFPLPARAEKARIDAVNGFVDEIAAENPRVKIIPWRDIVCPGGTRAEEFNGVDLWESDGVHLTTEGAQAVWNWWLAQDPTAR